MKQLPDLIVNHTRSTERKAASGSATHQKAVTSYAELPVALNAGQVAAVLGISRAGAYNLMRSEGFPTLFVGKRMIVPKERLLDWIDRQVSGRRSMV